MAAGPRAHEHAGPCADPEPTLGEPRPHGGVEGHALLAPMDESGVRVVAQSGRDVPAGVKNSPDIHDLIADDGEHQIREASQGADAEIRNLELVGESQACRLGRPTDLADGPFDSVHETHGNVSVRLGEVVVDRLIDVDRSPLAKSDRPSGHGNQDPERMRSRTDVKYDASATGPGDDAAPSSRTRRSC